MWLHELEPPVVTGCVDGIPDGTSRACVRAVLEVRFRRRICEASLEVTLGRISLQMCLAARINVDRQQYAVSCVEDGIRKRVDDSRVLCSLARSGRSSRDRACRSPRHDGMPCSGNIRRRSLAGQTALRWSSWRTQHSAVGTCRGPLHCSCQFLTARNAGATCNKPRP